MTPRSRTNQLLYQAELLLDSPPVDDEQGESRRMAAEEGALALSELALESLLREVTEHARLERHDWRELLGPEGAGIAELQRLRELASRPDTWMAWLLARLEALHGNEGAASLSGGAARGLIASGSGPAFADQLRHCLAKAKAELATLRETSQEW